MKYACCHLVTYIVRQYKRSFTTDSLIKVLLKRNYSLIKVYLCIRYSLIKVYKT